MDEEVGTPLADPMVTRLGGGVAGLGVLEEMGGIGTATGTGTGEVSLDHSASFILY